jgi:hypothetical protein
VMEMVRELMSEKSTGSLEALELTAVVDSNGSIASWSRRSSSRDVVDALDQERRSRSLNPWTGKGS